MKLRSLVLTGALALAVSAWADHTVTSTQMLGLMNVPSSATNTMISVPWLGVGGTAVKVCDLVKTDTLTPGDQLYYYNASGTFDAWTLTGGSWTPISTAGTASGVTTAVPAANQTILRGKALWLVRQDTSKEIWIYGQYSTDAISTPLAKGSASASAYTMIANPTTSAKELTDGGAGDLVQIPGDNKTYTYDGSSWGYNQKIGSQKIRGNTVDTYGWKEATLSIPAGAGAWYISKSSNTPDSIAW